MQNRCALFRPSQHDAQMDYYGKRLATCSSDRKVKIFDVPASGEPVHVADLTGFVEFTERGRPLFLPLLRIWSFPRSFFHYMVIFPCRHEGPVWEVAWAHPKFGVLLASCSYDRQVIVYREVEGAWSTVHIHKHHESSGAKAYPSDPRNDCTCRSVRASFVRVCAMQ